MSNIQRILQKVAVETSQTQIEEKSYSTPMIDVKAVGNIDTRIRPITLSVSGKKQSEGNQLAQNYKVSLVFNDSWTTQFESEFNDPQEATKVYTDLESMLRKQSDLIVAKDYQGAEKVAEEIISYLQQYKQSKLVKKYQLLKVSELGSVVVETADERKVPRLVLDNSLFTNLGKEISKEDLGKLVLDSPCSYKTFINKRSSALSKDLGLLYWEYLPGYNCSKQGVLEVIQGNDKSWYEGVAKEAYIQLTKDLNVSTEGLGFKYSHYGKCWEMVKVAFNVGDQVTNITNLESADIAGIASGAKGEIIKVDSTKGYLVDFGPVNNPEEAGVTRAQIWAKEEQLKLAQLKKAEVTLQNIFFDSVEELNQYLDSQKSTAVKDKEIGKDKAGKPTINPTPGKEVKPEDSEKEKGLGGGEGLPGREDMGSTSAPEGMPAATSLKVKAESYSRLSDWEELLSKEHPKYKFVVYDHPGETHEFAAYGIDAVKKGDTIYVDLYENFEADDSMARTMLREEVADAIKRNANLKVEAATDDHIRKQIAEEVGAYGPISVSTITHKINQQLKDPVSNEKVQQIVDKMVAKGEIEKYEEVAGSPQTYNPTSKTDAIARGSSPNANLKVEAASVESIEKNLARAKESRKHAIEMLGEKGITPESKEKYSKTKAKWEKEIDRLDRELAKAMKAERQAEKDEAAKVKEEKEAEAAKAATINKRSDDYKKRAHEVAKSVGMTDEQFNTYWNTEDYVGVRWEKLPPAVRRFFNTKEFKEDFQTMPDAKKAFKKRADYLTETINVGKELKGKLSAEAYTKLNDLVKEQDEILMEASVYQNPAIERWVDFYTIESLEDFIDSQIALYKLVGRSKDTNVKKLNSIVLEIWDILKDISERSVASLDVKANITVVSVPTTSHTKDLEDYLKEIGFTLGSAGGGYFDYGKEGDVVKEVEKALAVEFGKRIMNHVDVYTDADDVEASLKKVTKLYKGASFITKRQGWYIFGDPDTKKYYVLKDVAEGTEASYEADNIKDVETWISQQPRKPKPLVSKLEKNSAFTIEVEPGSAQLADMEEYRELLGADIVVDGDTKKVVIKVDTKEKVDWLTENFRQKGIKWQIKEMIPEAKAEAEVPAIPTDNDLPATDKSDGAVSKEKGKELPFNDSKLHKRAEGGRSYDEMVEELGYEGAIKELWKEAESYFQGMNIVPDQDDIISYVIDIVEDETGAAPSEGSIRNIVYGEIEEEASLTKLSNSNYDVILTELGIGESVTILGSRWEQLFDRKVTGLKQGTKVSYKHCNFEVEEVKMPVDGDKKDKDKSYMTTPLEVTIKKVSHDDKYKEEGKYLGSKMKKSDFKAANRVILNGEPGTLTTVSHCSCGEVDCVTISTDAGRFYTIMPEEDLWKTIEIGEGIKETMHVDTTKGASLNKVALEVGDKVISIFKDKASKEGEVVLVPTKKQGETGYFVTVRWADGSTDELVPVEWVKKVVDNEAEKSPAVAFDPETQTLAKKNTGKK